MRPGRSAIIAQILEQRIDESNVSRAKGRRAARVILNQIVAIAVEDAIAIRAHGPARKIEIGAQNVVFHHK